MAKAAKQQTHPDQDVFERVLGEAMAFLKENGLHILLVVAFVAVVSVSYKTYRLRRSTQALTQWELVASWPDPGPAASGQPEVEAMRKAAIGKLQDAADNGPRTAATPWVVLKLAGLRASGGNWTGAQAAYRRLLAEYPESAAADAARQGLAVALEEAGQYGQAAELYEALGGAGPAAFLLDAGRARELAGDGAAAEALYRRAIERSADEPVRSLAEFRLAELAGGRLLTPPPAFKAPEPPELRPSAGEMSVPADTPTAVAVPPVENASSEAE